VPVVFKEGFKFNVSRFPQISMRSGFEEELDGLPVRISPVLHCSFL
jgi:hypothetical protein